MQYTRLLASTCASAIVLAAATPAIAGDITGHVFDSTETVALQSAQVRIVELDRVVTTERDGTYRFAEIPAGSYTLEVRYVGAETVSRTIKVGESGLVQLDIALGGDNEILVVGQAANQASSLSRKREADGVSDVLTRDAIGEFPDQNVAESLRRLPGINILDDQGEGRFVSVRGLDPELNSSSLNGVRLPAPESDIRAVALDVVSSDIIESIEVKKSLTPDMDGDTIGASIEIKTTSAFDRKKDLLSINAEGSYNDYSGKVTPKGSLDFSTRLGEDFGIAGGVSYYEREFETDNVETGGGWSEKDGIIYNDEVQYRDYDVKRKRINAALTFDMRVSDTTKLSLSGNFSQFDDHEYRNRVTFKLPDPVAGDASGASFSDDGETIEIQRDIKDRFERQRIRTVVFNGETDTGIWKATYSASWAKSSELEDFSPDPIRFRNKFKNKGVGIDFDYGNPQVPAYTITEGASLVNDPSQYGFNKIDLTDLSDSQDEEYALKGDLARTFPGNGGDFTVQAGVKSRWRTKSYDNNQIDYDDYDGDFTLADVLGEQTYRLADMGPVTNRTGATEFFLAHRSDFSIDADGTALDSAVKDYSVKEDVLAGYMLGRWENDQLRAIGGVRVERTWNKLNGNDIVGEEPAVVTPVSYERSYTDWLPSVTLRFQPTPQIVTRLAAYKSLVRPKLSNLAPRFVVNADDEGEFGNPDLQPYRAWNFDGGFEYYFGRNAALTAAVFYKTIDNFIVTKRYDDTDAPYMGSYEGVSFATATIPINGGTAEVFGIEASYSQSFAALPEPFDGLLVQANYTYTDAKGDLYDEDNQLRSIPLPASSRNTFNLVLGYEKGPIDLRVSGTYRSSYLDEAGGSAEDDRYVDNHFQIDASLKVKVTDNLRVFVEGVNLNNATYFAYQNFEGSKRLLQFEKYGPTFKFGVKANF